CLFLGVAAIAGVGSLTRAIELGMTEEGQSLLGGDVKITSSQIPMSDEGIAFLASKGELSVNVQMLAMTRATSNDRVALSSLKSVDDLYPLYGELKLNPPMGQDALFAEVNGMYGAALAPELAERFRVGVGEVLKIGDTRFEVRAIIEREPDQGNEGIQFGPRVLIADEAMPSTNLIREGSMVSYLYSLRLAENVIPQSVVDELNEAFPDHGWRHRLRDNAAPGVRRFVDRMGSFLTLVGLAALLVGGVGVGNAIRDHMESRMETIATLKVLGSDGGLVFKTYITQVMVLAFFAVLSGVAVGSFIPLTMAGVIGDAMPVEPRFDVYYEPLVMAAGYGFLITLAFAIWPLARAKDTPPARLYRDIVQTKRSWPRWPYLAVIGASIAAVAVLAIGLSNLKELAAYFFVAALVALAALKVVGMGVAKLAARVGRIKSPALRLALANLHRPGSSTGVVVISMGLGLMLFATIALVEGNLSGSIERTVPDKAPDFFMFDIQKNQVDEFRSFLADVPEVSDTRIVAAIRAKVIKLKGVPVSEVEGIDPDVRWVVRGDRTMTISKTLPQANSIEEGEWWDENYAGPPLVSISTKEARGLGLGVGDMITVNIMGREMDAEIANLRNLDWGTYGFNFVLVFAPGALDHAPFTYRASIRVDETVEPIIHRDITDNFPNVTALRMRDVLATINGMLGQIGTAVRGTAIVAILAGILVLAGALAAGHRKRMHEAVVLKILGAVRRDVLKAFVVEYAMLGAIVGVVAFGLATIAGYLVIENLMSMEFVFLPAPMALTVFAGVALTVGFGLMGTWGALNARPAAALRAA
ncbi:MAG: FtsX-like permease family protein, partial [Sphingomonadales bacterium]|nr:FtsX-like permease family protein [Sphingomonadales bacterium]